MVIGPMFFYKVEERVFYRLVALMLMGKSGTGIYGASGRLRIKMLLVRAQLHSIQRDPAAVSIPSRR